MDSAGNFEFNQEGKGERTIDIFVYVLLGIVSIAIFGFFVRLMQNVGCDCIFCAGRARHLGSLDDKERKQVLEYFANIEDRIPYQDTVFVCDECHRVNDDKISGNSLTGLSIRCKACGIACNLDESMTCQVCGAKYEWTTFKKCGDFQFLLPLSPSSEDPD